MISNLRLQQFRSYTDESFEFSPGVNIIVGPNASGKTNLLEALLVMASGKSYRVKDSELIMFSKPWARLDAQVPADHRSIKLVRQPEGTITKILTVNNEVIKRLVSSKKIPAVLFEPNHLQLFHRGPEVRRDYLDDLLEQLQPTFLSLRTGYRRTLAQRNRLLKQQPIDIDKQLFVWNVRLSELGGQIVSYRRQLVQQINQRLPKLYQQLSHSRLKAKANYSASVPTQQYTSALLHKLEATIQQDRERGFTSSGPHRDDLHVTLDDHAVGDHGSRGEIRTLVLVLKIIELELIEAKYQAPPLLLLDDVFSELDGARRQALTNVIKDHQTFITTTDADVVVEHFMNNCHIIPLAT